MNKFIYILILGCFIAACNETPATKTTSKEQQTVVEKNKPVTSNTATQNQLPSIPKEEVLHLFDKCDYIDYVFYNTNFSMSQNEKPSIQGTIAQISAAPVALNPNCKAAGRIFYQINGENVLEADLYFQEGCHYFVFLKEGKPAYANMMTDQGIAYMNNIFQQAGGMQAQ